MNLLIRLLLAWILLMPLYPEIEEPVQPPPTPPHEPPTATPIVSEPVVFEPVVPTFIPRSYLFVGNSMVTGLKNVGLNNLYANKTGISLKELNDKLDTLLPNGAYNAVVIEMGSNELGLYSHEEFVSEYVELIEKLGAAYTYCLSIPPVNESKSVYGARINNQNVVLYNSYVQEVCSRTGSTYVDCSEFFGSTLKSSWTGDGLHLHDDIYHDWHQWIMDTIGDK